MLPNYASETHLLLTVKELLFKKIYLGCVVIITVYADRIFEKNVLGNGSRLVLGLS